jgi:hypothetical protein
MVPTARLELARPRSLPPQDSVSTNSTTSAKALAHRELQDAARPVELAFTAGYRSLWTRRADPEPVPAQLASSSTSQAPPHVPARWSACVAEARSTPDPSWSGKTGLPECRCYGLKNWPIQSIRTNFLPIRPRMLRPCQRLFRVAATRVQSRKQQRQYEQSKPVFP